MRRGKTWDGGGRWEGGTAPYISLTFLILAKIYYSRVLSECVWNVLVHASR